MRKNVYILFPPGYSGNYVSWCISKSDSELAASTVDNPINTHQSDKYGGVGTTHLHLRFPTHIVISELMSWLIIHKPVQKQVYILNTSSDVVLTNTISSIMTFDPEPVFIQIHTTDPDVRGVGGLNTVLKWPYYHLIRQERLTDLASVNFLKSDDNMTLRNYCVNKYDWAFPSPELFDPLKAPMLPHTNPDRMREFLPARHRYKLWYDVRNKYHPHEVNPEQFIEPYTIPENFFGIELAEIYSPGFPQILEDILIDASAGIFDFVQVHKIHQSYVGAQANIAWLDEIKLFRETKKLTPFLTANSVVQAMVIHEIKLSLPADYDWESKDIYEIVEYFNSV